MPYLEKIKVRLGLTDTLQDDMLNNIIDNVQAELIARLPLDTSLIPKALDFIVIEVAIKRYNRTGAEGMSAESVDGRSSQYEQDDFAQYADILAKYNDDASLKGAIHFY